MKKRTKRLLMVIICLALIIGVLSIMVIAVDETAGGADAYVGEGVVYNNTDTINTKNGDVNRDGKIANDDLVIMARYIVGLYQSESVIQYGDMNNDGRVTNEDIITVARTIVGLISPDIEDLPLVTDAYSRSFEEFGETYYQHIPQINLPNNAAEKVNVLMKKEVLEAEWFSDYAQVEYMWIEKDGVVSIIIETALVEAAFNWFHVYNVSIETGDLIQDTELLEMYDLSYANFYDIIKNKLNEFHKMQAEFVGEDDPFLQEQWAKSIADLNLRESKPYININGELCAVVKTYAIAGGDYYYRLYNITGDTEPTHPCNYH